jgi:ligand-binding SRPBCC domain-containing protein
MHFGSKVIFSVPLVPVFGLLRKMWVAEVAEHTPPQGFRDRQIAGPFSFWEHRHQFEPEGDGTRIIDTLNYEPPLGLLGRIADRLFIKRRIKAMWAYRTRKAQEILADFGKARWES